MPERTCSVDGCNRAHRARGFCSTCYNRDRYTPDQRHPSRHITCVECGVQSLSSRQSGKYCSDSCKAKAYASRPPTESARWARSPRVRRAKLKLGVAALGRAGFNWTSGWCHRCGVHFVDRNLDTRFCSARCQRRSDSARRRARESGADSDGYRRHLVFERDGWRCHMCGELTDPAQVVPHPKAPTIDHLLPLARGGSDTLGNVSTACFKCNCMKGDRQSHPPFLLVTEGGGYP